MWLLLLVQRIVKIKLVAGGIPLRHKLYLYTCMYM